MLASLKSRTQIWLIVYLIYLFILTLSPFQFSLDFLKQYSTQNLIDLTRDLVYLHDIHDIIANLFLFIPFGILFYFLTLGKSRFRSWMHAVLAGGIISFGIESAQLFLDRSTNGMDIIMNILGSHLGFFLAGLYEMHHQKAGHFYRKINIPARWIAVALYSICVILIFLLPLRLTTPATWNARYPLLIGNETSGDRPWQGEVYLAALYDRALNQDQVRLLNQSGINSKAVLIRRPMGLIAAYPFTEDQGDTLFDMSGFDRPLNLVGDSVIRLADGGIRCTGGIIRSAEPGKKIVEAVQESRAFSVEVWCRPDNFIQAGPARIVSLSKDVSLRNFALAQQGDQVHLRFRSVLGGENGSDINLRAKNVLIHDQTYHLIATYNHGVEQLFVNGYRHPDVIYGHISYLPEIFGLGRGIVGQVCMMIGVLFPLSVLIASLVRRYRLIVTAALLCTPVYGIDLFYMISYGAPLCALLIWTIIISAVLGVLFSRNVMTNESESYKV